jgi:hypothetical protein
MMLLTSVFFESDSSAVLESPNVAVSAGPFGTVISAQLAAVFQSPELGLRFQVALPASATQDRTWSTVQPLITTIAFFIEVSFGSGFVGGNDNGGTADWVQNSIWWGFG